MPVTDTSGVKRVAPTAVAGAGAGTAPPAPVINGGSDDDRGSLTFGSGTTPAAGVVISVTFATPKDPNRLPVVLIQEGTAASAGVDLAVTAVTSTGFSVSSGTRFLTASQANTVYGFSWLCVD